MGSPKGLLEGTGTLGSPVEKGLSSLLVLLWVCPGEGSKGNNRAAVLGQLPCSTHDNGVLCLQGGPDSSARASLCLGQVTPQSPRVGFSLLPDAGCLWC